MDFIFTTAEMVKSKKIYPALRLFLNSIFCISIATYIYSHCYPEQTTILKAAQLNLLGWFIDGNYFLPIVMVIFIWIATWMLGMTIWYTFNWILPRAVKKKIHAVQVGRQDVVQGLFGIRTVIRRFTSYHITQVEMTELYRHVKETLSEEELKELNEIFRKQEAEIQMNFYALFRLTIAMCIYWIWLPYFSTWLFVTLLVIVLVLMMLMLIGGFVITVLPDFAKKLDHIAHEFLTNQLPKRIVN